MKIPFTHEEFVEVFKTYNETVFPLQGIFYLFALISVFHTMRKSNWSSMIVMAVLSILWIWMGVVYHIIHFSVINKAANFFGAAFLIQGILLGYNANKIEFKFPSDVYGLTGFFLIFFALAVYPTIGYLIGHVYPYAPTFGVPCPTTIFTFGILLLTEKRCPIILLIIPGLWSIVGASAVWNLGFYEDIGLVISGIITIVMLLKRKRKLQQEVLEYAR